MSEITYDTERVRKKFALFRKVNPEKMIKLTKYG